MIENKLMPGHAEDNSELIILTVYKLYHYNIHSFVYIFLSSPILNEELYERNKCSVLF